MKKVSSILTLIITLILIILFWQFEVNISVKIGASLYLIFIWFVFTQWFWNEVE